MSSAMPASQPVTPPAPAPLAMLDGQRPPAPDWFERAIAFEPERERIEVAGAGIETLAWGERGRPGLLLVHGNGAHADWWSFIAPLLADHYRVAAFSLSGMGGSDWRQRYSIDLYQQEAMAVAQHTGLFEGTRAPVFVGHSFGSFPVVTCAHREGDRLGGAIVLDAPFYTREQRERRDRERGGPVKSSSGTRVYTSLEAAIRQFRFLPAQPVDNLFIADFIARRSLRAVEGGWTWRFDPMLWARYEGARTIQELQTLGCPIASLFGERSSLVRSEVVATQRELLPAGAPFIGLPDAAHHLMVDQPLALVAALRALLAAWPAARPGG
jgi:pimeloyl-ACP methyl ester carboxylesterase